MPIKFDSIKINLYKQNKKDINKLLIKIKNTYNETKYYESLNIIKGNYQYATYFDTELFPQNVNGIITQTSLPIIEYKNKQIKEIVLKEIKCYIELISLYSKEINLFCKLRNEFEIKILIGEYSAANDILETINEKFGYSFWYIKSMLLNNNYFLSLSQYSKYYYELRRECDNEYIDLFIRTLKRRVCNKDNNDDVYRFIDKKYNKLNKNKNKVLSDFYYYYNREILALDYKRIYSMLKIAANLNLIDMYLLIDDLLSRLMSQEFLNDKEKDDISKKINSLNIPFSLYYSSQFFLHEIKNDELTKIIYTAKEYLCKENYIEGIRYCENNLIDYSNCFDLVLIYCQMLFISGVNYNSNNSLLSEIILTTISIFNKKGNYEFFNEFDQKIHKLLDVIDCFSFKYQYKYFFYCNYSKDNILKKLYLVTCNYYNRQLFEYIDCEEIIQKYNTLYGNYEVDWNGDVWFDNNTILDSVSYSLYKYRYYNLNELKNSYETYTTNNPSTILQRNKISELLFNEYVINKEYGNAIKLYTNLQFESKMKVKTFKNEEIDKSVSYNEITDLYSNIDFCIYAHLTNFRGAGGLKYNIHVYNSLTKLLKNNKVIVPSQLNENSFETHKLCYFFRHICKEELLIDKFSGKKHPLKGNVFTKKDILSERVSVLELSLNLETSIFEKKQIENQIEITKSKINNAENADLGEFSIEAAKILEESIYISDTEVIIPFYMEIKEIKQETNIINVKDINSGEYALFRNAFIKVKKAYTVQLNEQIGAYIRHGFFENELVKYFDKYSLLIKKEFNDKRYTSEELLLRKKRQIKLADSKQYVKELWDFSLELYRFIDSELKCMEIIHSSKNQYDETRFFITDEKISELAIKLIDVEDPYVIKKVTLDFLNQNSLINLKDMGIVVKDDIIKFSSKRLNVLMNSLKEDSELYFNAKKAKDNLNVISNIICDWFDFVKEESQVYSLTKYIEKTLNGRREDIIYRTSIENDKINVKLMHCVNLILGNLIMNAEEHSNLDIDELKIFVDVFSTNKNIIINFKNNLNCTTDKEEVLKNIESIEKIISNAENIKLDSLPKGKGFYLIAKSLNLLSNYKSNISFNKDTVPEFFELSIKIERI